MATLAASSPTVALLQVAALLPGTSCMLSMRCRSITRALLIRDMASYEWPPPRTANLRFAALAHNTS
jgi:hypothetical protein